MSEYKRLTYRYEHNPQWVGTIDRSNGTESENSQCVQRLCELEDEIENGTLVRLHCKVGDTVYIPWVWGEVSGVATLTVEHIDMQEDGQFRLYLELDTDIVEYEMEYREHLMSNFGKTWFTDKAEAEAKLRELKGE